MGRVVFLPPILALFLVFVLRGPTLAQERSAPVFLGVGGALGYWNGDGGEGEFAPFLGARIGVPVSPEVDLTADAILYPSTFGGLFAMAGVQIGFGERHRTFVRPMAGIVVAPLGGGGFWPDPGTAPAVGVAVGHEAPLGERFGLVVEVGAGFSSDSDESDSVLMAGVHLVPLGARRRD